MLNGAKITLSTGQVLGGDIDSRTLGSILKAQLHTHIKKTYTQPKRCNNVIVTPKQAVISKSNMFTKEELKEQHPVLDNSPVSLMILWRC